MSCESDVKDAPTLPFEDEPLSMLICADPDSLVSWTAPVDVVEQDLGRLVDAIGDLEPAPDEPFDCQFDGGVGFHLLLRLPQDRVVRVAGDTGGCSLIENAGQRWLGGDEFFLTALELVEGQRKTASPPPPCLLPFATSLSARSTRGCSRPTRSSAKPATSCRRSRAGDRTPRSCLPSVRLSLFPVVTCVPSSTTCSRTLPEQGRRRWLRLPRRPGEPLHPDTGGPYGLGRPRSGGRLVPRVLRPFALDAARQPGHAVASVPRLPADPGRPSPLTLRASMVAP